MCSHCCTGIVAGAGAGVIGIVAVFWLVLLVLPFALTSLVLVVSASMFDVGDCAGAVVGLCLGLGLLDFGVVGLVKLV